MDSNSRPNLTTSTKEVQDISSILEKDSIVLLGDENSSCSKLFSRLGFDTKVKASEAGLKTILSTNSPDVIVIDSTFTETPEELLLFIRSFDACKDLPVVVFSSSGLSKDYSKEFPNVDCVFSTNPGIIAGKVATCLRMAKMRGESNQYSSMHEKNLALRSALKEYKREWADAQNIQATLLESSKVFFPELDVAIYHKPLHHVGGDWYFIEKTLHNKIFMSLCDVTGHGLSAAFLGSMTRLALNAGKEEVLSERITRANDLLTPELPEGRFITAIATEFDPETKELELLRAGHPPALLFKKASNIIEEIKPNGFALGFMEGAIFPIEKKVLSSGDILIIYSDGITEAANRFKEMFGVPKLKECLLAASHEPTSEAIKEHILKAFKDFLDDRKLNDDVSLLVLRVP